MESGRGIEKWTLTPPLAPRWARDGVRVHIPELMTRSKEGVRVHTHEMSYEPKLWENGKGSEFTYTPPTPSYGNNWLAWTPTTVYLSTGSCKVSRSGSIVRSAAYGDVGLPDQVLQTEAVTSLGSCVDGGHAVRSRLVGVASAFLQQPPKAVQTGQKI